MDMTPVTSEAIHSVGYDGHNLFVKWKSGKTYVHKNVPQHVAEQFLNAPSKGKFHASNIRDAYPGEPA